MGLKLFVLSLKLNNSSSKTKTSWIIAINITTQID